MLTATRRRRIEWGDCDPAGIVFNPRFFEWFDGCTAGLFEAAGWPKHELVQTFGIVGIPLVETRAKFIIPSKFGDEVMIESAVADLRRSSFDVRHRLYNGGALAVDGFETRVWSGRDADGRLCSRPIPEEVADRLKAK